MATMSDGLESITVRISKLTQLVHGRTVTLSDRKTLLSQDGLLDALLVLYEECSSERLMRNQYVASFVKKYATVVGDLRRMRLSISDFDVRGVIGRGHFGEVLVVGERCTGDVYALKVLRKADTLAQQNVAFYEEERDIMARATSAWLTQLHYAFHDKQHLYLVMDFHPGGDLLSLLARHDDVFEESMARFYLAEMVLAIHALHVMGYIHRDIKPENILIDRTGHIKLADFGSACRLTKSKSQSVLNMPVGTPDYIAPEVLRRMNTDTGGRDSRSRTTSGRVAEGSGRSSGRVAELGGQTEEQFGPECDWWSLGVCAYEMLYGRTPFSDHDGGALVVTYSNIMNFEKCLKFPPSSDVSTMAVDLMRNLLTFPVDRLSYEQLRLHRFFADIDLDSVRQTRPPFIPTVKRSDDTSNFDEFERSRPLPAGLDKEKRVDFTGKDLPFVGFTFTKALTSAEKPVTTTQDMGGASKVSLERSLTMKSSELQGYRDRYQSLEQKNGLLQVDVEALRRRLEERDAQLRRLEEENGSLERRLAACDTENKSLKRSLELEKQRLTEVDIKAARLLEELVSTAEQQASRQADEYRAVIERLSQDNVSLRQTIADQEAAIGQQASVECDIDQMSQLRNEWQELCRSKCRDILERMKRQENEFVAKKKKVPTATLR